MVPSINNNHHKLPLSGGAKNIWSGIAKHYNFTIHDTLCLAGTVLLVLLEPPPNLAIRAACCSGVLKFEDVEEVG